MNETKEIEAEVIEDSRTGEVIPRGANDEIPLPTEQRTIINVHQIGVLNVSVEAVEKITAPLDENDVQIRPDGLVYLPWTWRAKRLNDAFGIFQWGMIPQGAPLSKRIDDKNTLVVWGWWLVVKGVPVAFSYGETSYRHDNKTMSYGDACEGAKSNALSRNCKQIGMPDIELYSADWADEWKAKHAERVKNPKGNYPEYIWRKKSKKVDHPKATEPVVKTEPEVVEPAATEEVKATTEATKPEPVYETLFTYADLKGMEAELAKKANMSKAKIAIQLGKMDKTGSYSIPDVIKTLKGE